MPRKGKRIGRDVLLKRATDSAKRKLGADKFQQLKRPIILLYLRQVFLNEESWKMG